ncbi:endonuclease/exonuclease/phosphatase [Streptomyces sp. A7024]|uniref:Endonuclease/exonuclease/phosphatase n=1 Tax=Streptomyces coryli TaxID=1128680 RepID=A0A6G4U145_9ACTN|nr:endonuclease/exonuclease/phosphatase family protein [Streptomyces coryli]NGN65480.1 endonuclease/exonuclease/phosphatase [Streptomyces coryli]
MSRRSLAIAAATATALTAGLLTALPSASAAEVRIHDIQGAGRQSPLAGQTVAEVPGVVTGVRGYGSARGFWFQDPDADGEAATSEGVFVFTGSTTPTVKAGDSVRVSGTVTEYVPGGASSGNQSLTQITKPTVTPVESGAEIPAAQQLTADEIPDAYTADGDLNALPLKPDAYALDRWESLEGMNVSVTDARVVGATDAFNELWATVKPDENPTRRGGTRYGSYTSQNGGRLQIQQLVPISEHPFPKANVGDVVTGTTEGPLDYNQFGGYTLTSRTPVETEDRGLTRETTREQDRDQLAVATYNVENLDPGDPQEKFDKLAEAVVANLRSPDVVALEEVQDDNGAKNDGTVSAEATLKKLTDAIAAAGGPRYDWRQIDPADKQDGGEPGGNIRQAFLFNPDRVSFTDRAPGDATTPTEVTTVKGRAALTHSPGRIAPADAAWKDSRKPLAGEFVFRGRTVFVIANHFSSKGGDQGLTAATQPPNRSSEARRTEQAKLVNAFVKDIRGKQRSARTVVLGDINDFEFSATTKALTADRALRAAAYELPRAERYSYVYQGNSQILDQILVSPSIDDFDYDVVHINAEFHDQNSDHDPGVLRFEP